MALDDVKFAATNLEHLPKYAPEEVNICAVVYCQVKDEEVIRSLT